MTALDTALARSKSAFRWAAQGELKDLRAERDSLRAAYDIQVRDNDALAAERDRLREALKAAEPYVTDVPDVHRRIIALSASPPEQEACPTCGGPDDEPSPVVVDCPAAGFDGHHTP